MKNKREKGHLMPELDSLCWLPCGSKGWNCRLPCGYKGGCKASWICLAGSLVHTRKAARPPIQPLASNQSAGKALTLFLLF